jgi:hypothetical protein
MTAPQTIGEIDLLGDADLTELVHHVGPAHVSLFMPAHRAGPDTRQDPIRFRNLLSRARTLLTDQEGMTAREADGLLAPVRELGDDTGFWQHQADGLAVYVAPGLMRSFRVPLELDENVAVGPRFHLRPLLPLLAGDGQYLVLAVSQNEVRLYAGTRFTIAELEPGPIPTSMDEALAHEDREEQRLERYLRAIDHGLIERIGPGRRTPLVLASVGYYLPIFAGVSDHPTLAERAVEGNPENRSAQELHTAAWEIVAPAFEAARHEAVEALKRAEGTGRVSTDVASVVQASLEGRVDTLFLAGDSPAWGRVDGGPPATVEVHDTHRAGDNDLLDLAASETLLAGGTVYTGESVPSEDGSLAAAHLRW